MITGAVHDKYKRKKVENETTDMLLELCEKYGVHAFHKTCCAAAYAKNRSCVVHDMGMPQNIDIMKELGYKFSILEEGSICLDDASTGDLNFLRMLTRSNIFTEKLTSNYNLLSFKSSNYIFEASSSWFSWSNNTYCDIDCDYCIIRQINYLDLPRKIGCKPYNLLDETLTFSVAHEDEETRIKYKVEGNKTSLVDYSNVRVTKDCRRGTYPPRGL